MPAGVTTNPVSAYANARQTTATAERPRLTREQTAALTDTIAGMTRGGASSDEITAAVQKQTQGFLETNARAAQPQAQPQDAVELSDAAKRQGTAQEPALTKAQTAAPQRKGMTDGQIMALRERATAQANRRMGGLGSLGGLMDLRI